MQCSNRLRNFALAGALGVWTLVVAMGFGRLWRYSGTPGRAARVATWPAECPLRPAGHGATLVLAIHPQCPCSAATIGELAELMAVRSPSGEMATAYALFVEPSGEKPQHSATWDSASAIPGVKVIADVGGRLSAQFGAQTSGQVYAFDPRGELLFCGGITPARGHMGDSVGTDAIREILHGRAASQHEAPVFGCALGKPPLQQQSGNRQTTVAGVNVGSD
ncbi:MAG TPA: hypothetical protein VH518_14665 [Tepidisphaeraceae bacterium]|jgi:hypothetical protein